MEYKFQIKAGREADYEEIKNINSKDGIGIAIIKYAEKWGYMMEEKISAGKTVAEAADATWLEADERNVSGAMFGFTTSVLVENWEYGDDLRKWHEEKFGLKINNDAAVDESENEIEDGISIQGY